MSTEDIATKIKKYRIGHLWTLKKMAEKAGVSAAGLCSLETRINKEPQDLTMAKLLRAFPDLMTYEPSVSGDAQQCADIEPAVKIG